MDAQSTRSAGRLPLAFAVVHCVLWLCVAVGILVIVPGYARAFREFNLQLPWLTNTVLQACVWFANHWFVVLPALAVFFALDWAALSFFRRNPATGAAGLAWSLVMAALPLLTAVMVAGSILLVLLKLCGLRLER